MIIYVNGCSFSSGTELFTEKYPEYGESDEITLNSNVNLRMHGLEHLAIYNETYSYSGVIAKHLGYDVLNQSICGAGNDRILMGSITGLRQLLDIYPAKDIIAIIGWSNIQRRVVLDNYPFNYCPPRRNNENDTPFEKEYGELISTHHRQEMCVGIVRYYLNINSLISFCRSHGIKLLMFDATFRNFGYDNSEEEMVANDKRLLRGSFWDTFYKNKVDTSHHYFNTPREHHSLASLLHQHFTNSFETYARVNQYELFKYHHPGSRAHYDWAQLLLKELNERKWV